MSVESIIENPSEFSLNNLRKNIKWNNGEIDLNDLWARLS
jgi:Zn-dependent oligopeptidase